MKCLNVKGKTKETIDKVVSAFAENPIISCIIFVVNGFEKLNEVKKNIKKHI